MSEKQVREHDKFMLRLPDGLRDRIANAAKQNNRSMNSELVATLERAYPQPVTASDLVRLMKKSMPNLEKRLTYDELRLLELFVTNLAQQAQFEVEQSDREAEEATKHREAS